MSCLLLMLNFLYACSDSDTNEDKDYLEISPNNLTLNIDAEAINKYFTVSSNGIVNIKSDHPEWCNPTISNNTTDNLKISVSKNDAFDNRKAIITISNGSESKDITINQAGKKTVLSVDINSVVVQFGKPEFTLKVTSNFPIIFELPEWIKEKEGNTWQNGEKSYNFSVSLLPEELSFRDGAVTIKPKENTIDIQPVSVSVSQKAIPRIIAHRGYWASPSYPQNSIASLQRAIDLGLYGSELDVWITTDGVVVLNHDATINGINVEQSSYADLMEVKLSNGESLPTLEQCIETIKKQKQTKLIIEIKPHSTQVNNSRAVQAVLSLVNKGGVADLVDYISFNQNICKELINNNPENRVACLDGNIPPEHLKSEGYWGLDYSSSVLKANTGWIKIAKEKGIKTNVWTINSTEDFEYFISMGVDFITTDYPQNLKALLSSK